MKLVKRYAVILMTMMMAFTMSACNNGKESEAVYSNPAVDNSSDALQLLKDGNKRFVEDKMENFDLSEVKREELTKGQKPFAVVITCSDSRVPPEYIFNQGLGDLFEIRVAGNVLGTDEIASVEYAVEHLGVELVVLMGHEDCGAVTAAVEADEHSSTHEDPKNKSINQLLEKIEPAIEQAKKSNVKEESVIDKAIDLNIEIGVQQLIESSLILSKGIESGEVQIIGAKYLMGSGEVAWFEE